MGDASSCCLLVFILEFLTKHKHYRLSHVRTLLQFLFLPCYRMLVTCIIGYARTRGLETYPLSLLCLYLYLEIKNCVLVLKVDNLEETKRMIFFFCQLILVAIKVSSCTLPSLTILLTPEADSSWLSWINSLAPCPLTVSYVSLERKSQMKTSHFISPCFSVGLYRTCIILP